MGFFKSIGKAVSSVVQSPARALTAVGTGGLSEFLRPDAFGVPGSGQYLPIIAGGAAGAAMGNPGLGAQLGAGVFSAQQSAQAQQAANAQNLDIAREQMTFSAGQAQKQMDFQERMSNTSFQRGVSDLKAAGLNPLLALPSGASSPSGASGSSAGATMDVVPQVAERAMASAMEAKQFDMAMKGMRFDNMSKEKGVHALDADVKNKELVGEGLRYDNELSRKRNKVFEEYPSLFKLHVGAGGINSAGGILRLLK